jgi:ubiquinone/menaquinone biosynthesis C-methylase UbiE
MGERSSVGKQYGDADGYDSYMGGWSAALAPLFVKFAAVGEPASLLDIGCGTGNLLAELAVAFPRAGLTGVDPSTTLLDKACQRPELARVTFLEGTVEGLPFERGTFDCTLSLLVLQEFSDRLLALRELRRVTRPGGIVAACQWDFSRMPVINALVEAISAINPAAGGQLSGNSRPIFAGQSELLEYWAEAGFESASAGRIAVSRTFTRFDDLWAPLLAGSTPSTLTLASLSPQEREEVRRKMRMRLVGAGADSNLCLRAEALVVRGRR